MCSGQLANDACGRFTLVWTGVGWSGIPTRTRWPLTVHRGTQGHMVPLVIAVFADLQDCVPCMILLHSNIFILQTDRSKEQPCDDNMHRVRGTQPR